MRGELKCGIDEVNINSLASPCEKVRELCTSYRRLQPPQQFITVETGFLPDLWRSCSEELTELTVGDTADSVLTAMSLEPLAEPAELF